jgi:hypothetical protein
MIERIASEEEYKTLQKQQCKMLSRSFAKCSASNLVEGGMSTVSPQAGSVVDYLIDSGVIEKAELFGSIVRNHFLKQEHGIDITSNDIDLGIEYKNLPDGGFSHYYFDALPIERLIQTLKQHPNVAKVQEGYIDSYNSVSHRFKVEFEESGEKFNIDFCVFTGDVSLIRSGDAPINSVTVDQDGQVYEHPYFMKHLKSLSYAPMAVDEERAAVRYEKMVEQIPGLKNIGSFHELPEIVEIEKRNKRTLQEISERLDLADAEEYGKIPKHPTVASMQAVNNGEADIPKILKAIKHQRRTGKHVSGTTQDFEEFFSSDILGSRNKTNAVFNFTKKLLNRAKVTEVPQRKYYQSPKQ